ncbi:MAG: hypothetical protein CVT72_03740 [Alphaproteobacteria bacterium HGW-Alphaproteobacteria-11]|nr:MAG: hypothetical protein CVT72_03740 [Alphaproteobacteria bacterium HGW-Alphaproteobacteria-11]
MENVTLPQKKPETFAISEYAATQTALSNSQIAKSLDAAADALEAEARRLRRNAAELRDHIDRQRRLTELRHRARAAAVAASRSGRDFGTAAHEIARQTGAPIEAVIQIMEVEFRKTARERLALRNEAIMRLKRQGLTNAEIGDRIGLHEKSVARIGGRMRRNMVYRA